MSQKSYINDKPILYLIPTPIGNMEDITLRAINILKEVEVIFSEDTRVTRQLLNYLNINKKLISSHNYNETKNENILLDYLNKGYNVGVVTDRGTPVISDPGYELVKIAIKNDFNVVSLPGPTALIPALTVSGINPSPFTFYGFLNSKDSARRKELEILKNEDNEDEIGFRDVAIAKLFFKFCIIDAKKTSENGDIFCMNYMAEIIKKGIDLGIAPEEYVITKLKNVLAKIL